MLYNINLFINQHINSFTQKYQIPPTQYNKITLGVNKQHYFNYKIILNKFFVTDIFNLLNDFNDFVFLKNIIEMHKRI